MAANASGAVVVTGASSGIGRATALLLDAEGYRVFAGVRKEADAREISQDGSDRLTPISVDVTDAGQIEAARQQVAEAVGVRGWSG
jgi:NADP-dependent 3-hydroxy acid dehydrogenase YdfG